MSKITIANRYGTVPNDILNHTDLSFKAKGLFAFLQSKPDDWSFSVERIVKQTKDGKDSISAGLKELENFGFLLRLKKKLPDGTWNWEYVLSEKPFTENPSTVKPEIKKERYSKQYKNHKNDSYASQFFEKNENEEGQEDDLAYEESEDAVTPRRASKRKFPTKNGKDIVIGVASDYEADGWSPKDRLALKRKIEKSLGLGRSTKWTQMLYGSLWDFKKAFRFYEKYEYVGDVAPVEVARMLSALYEAGETRETIRDMLRAYFESEKAKSIAITPTAAFSSHTYNSWKQGKLVPPKVEKRKFWE